MKVIVTTTGTSLLTNTARALNKKNADVTDDELRHYFEQVGAEKASAETNSLPKIATPDDAVVMLYTATPEGERCAKQIESYLKSKDWRNLRLRKLQLEQNEAQFERKGLRNLVDTIIDEINKAQRERHEVIINATGGFKAEIAYTTMVGMIFQVPVKYIYQDFEKPITFPVLPITWNLDLLIEYDRFFGWLDEEPRTQSEVEQRLKAVSSDDRGRIQQLLSPPDSEQYIYLSPAGDILWKRLRQVREVVVEEPPPSERKASEKLSTSLQDKKHHFPRGTKEFAERVAALPAVEEIIGGNFENTTLKRVKSVSDDGVIRVLWADNEKAANLTIRTTALGQAQTIQFCDRYIKPLLENA
jgi:putative CRISPR-associated protein (TIGR02619 family)